MQPPIDQSSLSSDLPESLEFAHQRLIAALKASRCGTWSWDIPKDVIKWDEALSSVYGIPHAQAPKNSKEFIDLIHPEDRDRVVNLLKECLQGRSASEVECEFRALIDNRIFWIYDRCTLIRDGDGGPFYMTGAGINITERKRVEQERDAALEQHRLLLRELNHRVNNHLQLISSILYLQSARQENAEVRSEFEKAIRRVETLADLHAHLYQGEQLGDLDVSAYLSDICDNLRKSVLNNGQIALECDLMPVTLSLDKAVPIGLIVNELTTNAIKHAFPEGAAGRIRVSLSQKGDEVRLRVEDNGCGLSRTNAKPNNGLGRRMIDALASQIGAIVTVDASQGAAYDLSFKVN